MQLRAWLTDEQPTEAPCFSRGELDLSPAEKSPDPKTGFSPGPSNSRSKALEGRFSRTLMPYFTGVSRGRVRAGERVRVGLVLGSGLEVLDGLIAVDAAITRRDAWESKWRSWGVEPVAVVADGSDADAELTAAGASIALVLGRAEVSLPAVRVIGGEGWRELAAAVGELFTRGVEIDWSGWEAGLKRRPVRLPTYAFQRERFWIEPQGKKKVLAGEATGSRLLGRRLRTAGVQGQFEVELALEGSASWISEHVFDGHPVLPLTGHLELMLQAGAEVLGAGSVAVEDAVLHAPLTVEQMRKVQTVVEAVSGERSRVRIYAENPGVENAQDAWQAVSEGWIRAAAEPGLEPIDLEGIRARLREQEDISGFYAAMAAKGAKFGPKFRGLRALWSGPGEALGEVQGSVEEEAGYRFAPWRLDACLQIFGTVLEDAALYMPSSVGEIAVSGSPGERCWSHMRSRRIDSATITADFTITQPDGTPLALFRNVLFRKVAASKPDIASWLYRLDWQPADLTAQLERASATPRILLIGTADQVDETAAQLRMRGAAVASIENGKSEQLISEALRSSPELDSVLYFVSSSETEFASAHVTAQAERPIRSLLSLVHQLLGDGVVKKPRLYLITQNACAIADDTAPVRLLETPFVGLANAIALEAPELRCTLIDGNAAAARAIAGQIADEILAGSDERRVAIRSGRRYIARLEKMPVARLAGSDKVSLGLVMGAGIDALVYEPVERREPREHEIEIAVRATALNFRDVLKATGLLEHAGAIGTDCAGVVVRTGAKVTDLQIGDAVVGIAPGCFANHVLTASDLVVRKPGQLSFEEAAAQTVAYLTSDYCLHQLAGLRKGQRVLIHAAAGGVGLAAVHLCRRAGAEVLATAGSEQKRAYLRHPRYRAGIRFTHPRLQKRNRRRSRYCLELANRSGDRCRTEFAETKGPFY